jgi:hypothetical protein
MLGRVPQPPRRRDGCKPLRPDLQAQISPIFHLPVAFFHVFKQQIAAVPLNARFSATLPIHPTHSLTHP